MAKVNCKDQAQSVVTPADMSGVNENEKQLYRSNGYLRAVFKTE